MKPSDPIRIDRRVAIKWMLTASASALLVDPRAFGALAADEPSAQPGNAAHGYGTDPDLMKAYKPGEVWPLTLTDPQRREVAALCDLIVPADAQSPSASAVGVTDFIDEWVSAPYPDNVKDAQLILPGLAWLESESKRRFQAAFADATDDQRTALCDEIAPQAPVKSALGEPAKFFRRFRNLVSAGFYTTPEGMKDLGYVGNVPLARFEGPPADLIARLGLSDEVRW